MYGICLEEVNPEELTMQVLIFPGHLLFEAIEVLD